MNLDLAVFSAAIAITFAAMLTAAFWFAGGDVGADWWRTLAVAWGITGPILACRIWWANQ